MRRCPYAPPVVAGSAPGTSSASQFRVEIDDVRHPTVAPPGADFAVRGSSTSSSMFSPGKVVAPGMSLALPSETMPCARRNDGDRSGAKAKTLGSPSSQMISSVAVPSRTWISSSPVRWRSQ